MATLFPQANPLLMLPFAAMLLCISLLPFLLKHHWERNYHLAALGLAAIPVTYYVFVLRESGRMLHQGADYLGFITLVGSLFVVAGGIHVAVSGRAKPLANCAFLFVGALLANFVGTTGASML
ncbi:MAG: sodium:proton antiporter, partial [Verrucomicrobiota bacterium]|nr:sodium:proton antiporter [Verrucomicrobiota bacterium]